MSWIQLWNISQMISLTLIVKLRKLVKYFTDESSSIFYQKFSSKTKQDHVSRFSSIRSFNFIVLALSDLNNMRNSSFMKISTLMLHNINQQQFSTKSCICHVGIAFNVFIFGHFKISLTVFPLRLCQVKVVCCLMPCLVFANLGLMLPKNGEKM